MTNTEATTPTYTSSSIRARRSRFTQINRVPWVPDRLLQQLGGICEIDSRFRRAVRLLAVLWMHDSGIESAASGGEHASYLASHLSADAAEAGLNFHSPDLHLLALKELLLLREEDAAVDEDRLLSNPLSSMPLAVNLFGPLALDTKLGSKVLRQLLPDFVHSVQRIVWEHSPGRKDPRYLSDRTAFDLAIHVATPEGEPGIVYIEVKLSEELLGPVARWRDRYSEALHEVRLYKDPDSPILRTAPVEQLFREHAVAQKSVDNGVVPRAMFIAIGPRLNRRVQAAFKVYANELLPVDPADPTRVAFRHFTLEAIIDAIDVAGDGGTADQLWKRYCDFQRIYDAALAAIAPKTPVNETPSPVAAPAADDTKLRPQEGNRKKRIRPAHPASSSEVTDAANA
ncbi:PGN_0703 family putative restriction endonuclease [Bradyrhizobium diazoefficiens]